MQYMANASDLEVVNRLGTYEDAEEEGRLFAPNWLASRINYRTIKFLYRDIDGHAELKGVRIGDEVAQIGDTVQFNGRRLSVERR